MTKKVRSIFIIISLLLICAVTGWFINKKYHYFFSKQTPAPSVNHVQEETADLGSPERIKKISELEKNYQDSKKAVTNNDITLCPKTQESEYEECLFAVASTDSNWQLCSEIKNAELRSTCVEFSLLRTAITAGEIKQCEKLTSKEFYRQCLLGIITPASNLSVCDEAKTEEKTYCTDIVNRQQAQAMKDVKLCEKIIDPALKSDCEVVLKNLSQDSDQDGLTDAEENAYGTDAFSADTDGDGFSDKVEITKGYDPRKKDR
jgi:hypothetical protein